MHGAERPMETSCVTYSVAVESEFVASQESVVESLPFVPVNEHALVGCVRLKTLKKSVITLSGITPGGMGTFGGGPDDFANVRGSITQNYGSEAKLKIRTKL